MAKLKNQLKIEVSEIAMREINLCFLGTSPMIMHRFSQKAWRELLLPSRQKNRAELEQSLKHDPVGEFRGALYRNRDDERSTLFHIPNGAFAKAIAAAALDLPGAKKAQIERLTRVVDVNIDLYGVPQLFMAMVRNSDMGRTPDVRTRPIFPQWAGRLTVSYVKDILSERVIMNLAGAAGQIVGIGDWRPQKGGPYGCFQFVSPDDPEFKLITSKQGRTAQQKAFDHPAFFDEDTAELMAWFEEEVRSREMQAKASHTVPTTRKSKAKRSELLESMAARTVVENGDGRYSGVE